MPRPLIVLTIPGLRQQDVARMPRLAALGDQGVVSSVDHAFPTVTWPSQATVLTGLPPSEHGVVANGLFDRASGRVTMWTMGAGAIDRPQVWDRLEAAGVATAAWFPMLAKNCGAAHVCMPAPVHNPDGSESLWCYTKPTAWYGPLRDALGHFPLQHFWGPLANIKSSQWIADSAVMTAETSRPPFWYIYLPHLDYAAQKSGPDSDAALAAVTDLDALLGGLFDRMDAIYGDPVYLVISEYVITAVTSVTYPNRTLREAGLLTVTPTDGGELIDFTGTPAWALVDHQFSHVFVKDRDARVIERVASLFRGRDGFAEVLAGSERARLGIDHERAGDVILVSPPDSWQSYYYWTDDGAAPKFARTVDIHRKPGYDPVELFFDRATKSIPLDATLVQGSHGAVVTSNAMRGALVASSPELLAGLADGPVGDTALAGVMLRHFGVA